MEEPRQILKMGGYIDEEELKVIHILYDSLQLKHLDRFDNWVKETYSGYSREPRYYSPEIDPYIFNRQGLVFTPDSVGRVYHVTGINLDALPDIEDICLPDVFDKFKHLQQFRILIPDKAKITLPPSLCECPLVKLVIGENRISGFMPVNFSKLAKTLQYISIRSHYGNDLLALLPEFTELTYADLSENDFSDANLLPPLSKLSHLELAYFFDNNFTGKTPYFADCKTKFDFRYNGFTEFDWRYLEDYAAFLKVFKNKDVEFLIPTFRHNSIDGSFPLFFNEGFFVLYNDKCNELDHFIERIFGNNPIYNVYIDMHFEYLNRYPHHIYP